MGWSSWLARRFKSCPHDLQRPSTVFFERLVNKMPEMKIVARKVFVNFCRTCRDQRAWEAACCEQSNDSWPRFAVGVPQEDADQEYLRQWLLQNGAEEADEYVFLSISW